MRIIKQLLIGFISTFFAFILILFGILFWAVKNFDNIEQYKTQIFDNIKEKSGYEIYAEKISIKPELKPYLPVNVHHFIIYSPNGQKLLKSRDINFKIELLPLLKKRVKVFEIELIRPVFEIDTSKKQEFEFNFEPIEFNNWKILCDIKNLILKNYKVNVTDAKRKYSLEGENTDILNTGSLHSIEMKTNGVLYENSKELLKYDTEFCIPSKLLSKKGENSDNSAKKYIKAKIKSDRISLSKLRELYISISKAANLKTPFDDYKILGEGKFDFELNSDFKTLKSKGEILINNAEIIHNSIPFSVKSINSKINFENNIVNIENTKALINNNPVTFSGTINDRLHSDLKFNADNIELKNIVHLLKDKINFNEINIKSGTVTLGAELKAKGFKDYILNSDIQVKNPSVSDKTNYMSVSSKLINVKLKNTPSLISANISSDEIKSKFPKQKLEFSLKNVNADYKDSDLTINPSKITYGNCQLDISGQIRNIKDKDRVVDFLLQGDIGAKELEAELKKYFKFQSASKGKLPVAVKLDGKNDKFKLSAKINADKNNYLSLLVIKELLNKPSMLNITAEIKDKNIDIENISVLNLENTAAINNAKMTMDKVGNIAVISGNIKLNDKIFADNLKIKIPDSLTFSTGLLDGAEVSVKGDISLYGVLDNPKIKGNVQVNSLNLFKYQMLVKNSLLEFLDETIKVNIPDLRIADSQFNISAEVLPEFKDKIIIKDGKVSASKLNLETLIEKFPDVFSSDIFPGFSVPLTVKNASATIDAFLYEEIKLNDITCNFSLADDLLKIVNINSKGFDGTIKGNLDFNFLMQILKLDIKGNKLNTNKLIQALSETPTDLTGKTDLSARLQITGKTKEKQLKALRGEVSFTTNSGQLGVLGQFERYLQAQNILHLGIDRTKWQDLAKAVKTHNTSYFRRAEGKIIFDNGYAVIDDFKMQGNIMSLLILGKYNLLNDFAQLNIYGKISDEIFKEDLNKTAYSNDEIPDVLSPNANSTRGFKVNITGAVDNIRSINSFEWLDSSSQISHPQNNSSGKSEISNSERTYEKYPAFLNDI